MGRAREDEKKLTRGPDLGLPTWWTDYAKDWARTHGKVTSDKQLGQKLAAAVGRPKPWTHVTIGRFFRHDSERVTSQDIADALLKLYPQLPQYVIVPGDLTEALALAEVHRQAAERRAAEEEARDDAARHIVDRATRATPPPKSPNPDRSDRRPSA